jgi:hypothetical protein
MPYPIRPKENFGTTSKPQHFHDKYAAFKAGHSGDDPHAVTGPPAPVSGDPASVRPVPGPSAAAVVQENEPEFAQEGTEGQSMTMQYNYNPVPEYTQTG